MLNLFFIEFLKYRNLACLLALGHFLALIVLLWMGQVLTDKPLFPGWLLFCGSAAALFGCLQMLAHKRNTHWVWLLQRPLGHARILYALLLAAGCLLLIALVLPYLLILLLMDLSGAYVMELRHYGLLPLATSGFLSAYLLACFAALHPHRLAFLALLPCLALLDNNPGTRIVAAAILLPLYALLLVHLSFKPDPSCTSQRPAVLLLAELPIQFGLYWLLAVLAMMFYQVLWTLSGNQPVTHPAGNPQAVVELEPGELMELALESSAHPDSIFLRRQVAIGEVLDIPVPADNHYPQRNQRPTLDRNLTLNDPEAMVSWHFSHGGMLFEGFDRQTRKRIGWLSPAGFFPLEEPPSQRFDSVPRLAGNDWLMSDSRLYQIDWRGRRIRERFVLPEAAGGADDERLSNVFVIGPRVSALLSNRHLYLFRSQVLQDPEAPLLPSGRVALSLTGYPYYHSVAVLELIDAYLVSVLSIPVRPLDGDFSIYQGTELLLLRSDESLVSETFARVPLQTSVSTLFIYKGLILAPGMRLLSDLLVGVYLKKGAADTLPIPLRDIPLLVCLGMLVSILLSAGITQRLLRSTSLPTRTRRFWIVLNGLTGITGLLSLLIGHYWKRLSHTRQPGAEQPLRPLSA